MIVLRTQKEISEAIEVSPGYILRVKKKTKTLSRESRLKLIKFYQCKLIEIQNTINEISSKLLPSGSRKPYDKQKG